MSEPEQGAIMSLFLVLFVCLTCISAVLFITLITLGRGRLDFGGDGVFDRIGEDVSHFSGAKRVRFQMAT